MGLFCRLRGGTHHAFILLLDRIGYAAWLFGSRMGRCWRQGHPETDGMLFRRSTLSHHANWLPNLHLVSRGEQPWILSNRWKTRRRLLPFRPIELFRRG